jgi:hypothetical protein
MSFAGLRGGVLMPKFYLFPGAHKTGTTLLQDALHSQEETLSDAGIFVLRRSAFHLSPVFEATRRLRRNKEVDPADLEESQDWAEDIARSAGEKDVVLSVESLFGEVNTRFYGNAGPILRYLRDLFPAHEFLVKYYVRRQDTFLTSAYLQKVHKGNPKDAQKFTEAMMEGGMSWNGVLDQIAEVVGRSNVVVRPFEAMSGAIDAYVGDFFSTFLKDETTIAELVANRDGTETNISLSEIGLRVALDFFERVEDKSARLILVKTLQRHAGVDKLPRARLYGPDQIGAFRDKYAEDNARLFSDWDLPAKYRNHYLFAD